MASQSLMTQFGRARSAGAPIIAIRTSDQFETLATIVGESTPNNFPVLVWDTVRGITPPRHSQQAIDLGEEAMKKAKINPEKSPVNFVTAMVAAANLPQFSILVCLNAQRQLDDRAAVGNFQAVSLLRDDFKQNWRTLVLLGPDVPIPPDMEHDIVVLEHELPNEQELTECVAGTLHGARKADGSKLPEVSKEKIHRAVVALSGTSMFAAEQNFAMSLDDDGINFETIWMRAENSIRQTPGLKMYRGRDRFDSLKGLASIKDRLGSRITAKSDLGTVVWLDEGSDVFNNVEADSNNVRMDQQRLLLTEMENNDWKGIICVGVPGSGKSAISRAFGNEAGVPTIEMDMAGMERKHVGESEQNVRAAMRTIKAIGRGNAFFILTCNSLRGIRPQFMSRFKKGVFFFDLPSAEERDAIWVHYIKKFGLDPRMERPNDDGWVGREIRECCEDAWDTGRSLLDASRFIIPVAHSRPEEIEAMRQEATGRFLDASRPGKYVYDAKRLDKKPVVGVRRRGVSVGTPLAVSSEIGNA